MPSEHSNTGVNFPQLEPSTVVHISKPCGLKMVAQSLFWYYSCNWLTVKFWSLPNPFKLDCCQFTSSALFQICVPVWRFRVAANKFPWNSDKAVISGVSEASHGEQSFCRLRQNGARSAKRAGSASRTRTDNLPVNSRLLYHWAIAEQNVNDLLTYNLIKD